MGPSGVHGGESGLSRNEPTRLCDCPWRKLQSLRQVRAGLQAPRSRLQAPPAAVQGQEGSSSVPLQWAERARDGGYDVLCPQSTELQGRAVPGALEFPPTCLPPALPSMKSHRGPQGEDPGVPLGGTFWAHCANLSWAETAQEKGQCRKKGWGSTHPGPQLLSQTRPTSPLDVGGLSPWAPGRRAGPRAARLCDSPGPLPREASRDTLLGPLLLWGGPARPCDWSCPVTSQLLISSPTSQPRGDTSSV